MKPTEYELATHKGRKIDESRDPSYCGSCSIEIHCSQVRDPKSWVHSSIKTWARLGGWIAPEDRFTPDVASAAILEGELRQRIADMQARHRQEISPLVDALIKLESMKAVPSMSFCISFEDAERLGILDEVKP